MPGSGRKPMKVVIINTHYVETDATSFKSVVQKLTGKDSTLANDPEESESRIHFRERMATTRSSSSVQILMRNSSFKEFDRLLREVPPLLMHELCE
ncbi:VQ motif-containing protein 10-like [Corylus avellana]|uniref:VQ motif-containing protein 10-like n=1 Tax=Corylus avellana TaxID=13451 RepID=UPI001E225B06|nr:VQ motif-containing protein 10-like [Corylus avellana]